jgi:hypothetical protein
MNEMRESRKNISRNTLIVVSSPPSNITLLRRSSVEMVYTLRAIQTIKRNSTASSTGENVNRILETVPISFSIPSLFKVCRIEVVGPRGTVKTIEGSGAALTVGEHVSRYAFISIAQPIDGVGSLLGPGGVEMIDNLGVVGAIPSRGRATSRALITVTASFRLDKIV